MALQHAGKRLDRIREDYRRRHARSPRAPTTEPTPERQAKAAGIGYRESGTEMFKEFGPPSTSLKTTVT
jgi:hypothetical protein